MESVISRDRTDIVGVRRRVAAFSFSVDTNGAFEHVIIVGITEGGIDPFTEEDFTKEPVGSGGSVSDGVAQRG